MPRGFFSYELGYCLEPKLKGLLPRERRVPLFWIGLFGAPRALDDAVTRAWLDKNGGAERAKISDLTLSWTREQYTQPSIRSRTSSPPATSIRSTSH